MFNHACGNFGGSPNGWGWKEPLKIAEVVAQVCVQLIFNISKDGDSTNSLGKLIFSFPYVEMQFPVFQFVPISSCVFSPLSSLHPPIRYLYTLRSPQAFFAHRMLQSLNHPCGSLLDSLQYVHVSTAGEPSAPDNMSPGSPPAMGWQRLGWTLTFLHHENALLAYAQRGVHHWWSYCLAFNMQDLILPFEVSVDLFLQLLQVLLSLSTTIWSINLSSRFCNLQARQGLSLKVLVLQNNRSTYSLNFID